MKVLHGVKNHPVQWIVFSVLAYLFIGIFVGGYFHNGPLIQSGDQFSDIPQWANVILIVVSGSIGAYASHKESKAQK
jgi:TctA family transporter